MFLFSKDKNWNLGNKPKHSKQEKSSQLESYCWGLVRCKMRIVKITRKKTESAEGNFDPHLAHNAAFSDAAALKASTQMLRTIAGLPCLCDVTNFLKLFGAIS